jgi:hypothetical protein
MVLLPAVARAYAEPYPAEKTMTGKPRQRQAGGGRKGGLPEREQKLLFILNPRITTGGEFVNG